MNFESTVRDCLLNYPTIYPTALQVYDHLFCTCGNGYEWKNGELISLGEERHANTIPEAISEFMKRRILENYKFYSKTEKLLEIFNKENEEYIKQIMEVDNRMHMLDIPKVDPFAIPSKPSTYEFKFYPLCEYAKICNIPDDIKPDWLEAVERMYNILNENQDRIREDGLCWLPIIKDKIKKLK